jgi:hypothetical protein
MQNEFALASEVFNLFTPAAALAPATAPAPLPDFTEPSPVLDPTPLPGEIWQHAPSATIAFLDHDPRDRLPWRFSLRSTETGKIVAQGYHHTRDAADAAALTTARALADQVHDLATEARAFPARTSFHD